jgi:hypothetical protein
MDTTENPIDIALEMVSGAWFQVLIHRELKQPADAAYARYSGMVKAFDAVLDLPERFEIAAQEAANRKVNDLHQKNYFSVARARLAAGGMVILEVDD